MGCHKHIKPLQQSQDLIHTCSSGITFSHYNDLHNVIYGFAFRLNPLTIQIFTAYIKLLRAFVGFSPGHRGITFILDNSAVQNSCLKPTNSGNIGNGVMFIKLSKIVMEFGRVCAFNSGDWVSCPDIFSVSVLLLANHLHDILPTLTCI